MITPRDEYLLKQLNDVPKFGTINEQVDYLFSIGLFLRLDDAVKELNERKNKMTLWIIVDNDDDIWQTYDAPNSKELKRVTKGETSLYNYNLITKVAQKYDGTVWNNRTITNNILTDGTLQIRFTTDDQVFEYFNLKENKWIIIPTL